MKKKSDFNFIIASSRNEYNWMANELNRLNIGNFVALTKREDMNLDFIESIDPHMIFVPHWSHIIPNEIHSRFECIIFHMTDLPFGRGGSPLQNLIVRGFEQTQISAIRCESGIDTGPVYLKKPLKLHGSATQIFRRAAKVIFLMIQHIILKRPNPVTQTGEVVSFKRRKPEDGDVSKLDDVLTIYNYIRMLDGEGYPPAFVETKKFILEFKNAKLSHGVLSANVCFRKKN